MRELSEMQSAFLGDSGHQRLLQVTDRRLAIGSHNSHNWVTPPCFVSLHRLEDGSLGFEGQVTLNRCPRDPYCPVVFEVYYTISSPKGKGHATRQLLVAFGVTMGFDGHNWVDGPTELRLRRGAG